MTQNNNESYDKHDLAEDSDQQVNNQDHLPEEADDIVGTEDVDIHGKLAHLNAFDMSKLTLIKRYVMITLRHPPHSDELGRLMTIAGAYPCLPALSTKQMQGAIDALIKDNLIATWKHEGSTCWEVAGAYAFKKGLRWHLRERAKINKRKKEEAAKRRQRKKDAEEGVPFVYEDDGTMPDYDSTIYEKVRTKRGNLVDGHPEFFFNSFVPQRKGKRQHEMLLNQPRTSKGCILRMLASFDPTQDLKPLAAVIRFYLLMDSDDYGRVRVDVKKIHGQLGPAITKRVSKNQVKQELDRMQRSGHLILFDRKQGVFAYIRDAAQHLLGKKRYDREIPKLYDDREFTYDSDRYKAFFEACKEHSAKRDKVNVAHYCERGDIIDVTEYAEVAAERFAKHHEEIVSREPYCSMTLEQLLGFESSDFATAHMLRLEHQFYHGFKCQISVGLMLCLYLQAPDLFDGTTGGDPKEHRILKHLIGMTPREYVEHLIAGDGTPSVCDTQQDDLKHLIGMTPKEFVDCLITGDSSVCDAQQDDSKHLISMTPKEYFEHLIAGDVVPSVRDTQQGDPMEVSQDSVEPSSTNSYNNDPFFVIPPDDEVPPTVVPF